MKCLKNQILLVLRFSDKQTRHHLPHPPPSTEAIQVSVAETAAVGISRQPESHEHLCHDASPDGPIPAWTSGISARRRCRHLLEQTTGSLSTACPTGARFFSCACITGLRGAGILHLWIIIIIIIIRFVKRQNVKRLPWRWWLTAGHRNRLSENLEMSVFLKLNKNLVWLCDRVDGKPADACLPLPSCYCVTKL